MRSALLVVTALAVGLGGCSAATAGGSDGSRDLITREEIERTGAQTAYEVVRQLRPEFLIVRGSMGLNSTRPRERGAEPVVYVDGVRFGNLDSLHSIRMGDLLEIRRLSGADATTRFGTGHAGGAILVRTRHGN